MGGNQAGNVPAQHRACSQSSAGIERGEWETGIGPDEVRSLGGHPRHSEHVIQADAARTVPGVSRKTRFSIVFWAITAAVIGAGNYLLYRNLGARRVLHRGR